MTKRFRLGLLMALAAAVGLHLRPCLGCLVADDVETVASGLGQGGEFSGATVSGSGDHTVNDAGSYQLRRPSMTAMTAGPSVLRSVGGADSGGRESAGTDGADRSRGIQLLHRAGFGTGRPAPVALPASSFQATGFLTAGNVR